MGEGKSQRDSPFLWLLFLVGISSIHVTAAYASHTQANGGAYAGSYASVRGTHEVRGIDSHVFCEGLFLVLHNDERNVFGKPRRF